MKNSNLSEKLKKYPDYRMLARMKSVVEYAKSKGVHINVYKEIPNEDEKVLEQVNIKIYPPKIKVLEDGTHWYQAIAAFKPENNEFLAGVISDNNEVIYTLQDKENTYVWEETIKNLERI